ncbi:MAG: hypothetical protein IKS49_05570 [Actinomycetaceae bacterium]|nr:hypothetical protein [Actinomycetaceae bacterium]
MKKLAALVSVPLLALSLAACSGGDGASKEDVTKGLTKTMDYAVKQMGLDGLESSVLEEYVTCIVDKSYDELSPATRDTLAKGSTEDITEMKISQEDSDLLEKNVEACSDTLVNALLQ